MSLLGRWFNSSKAYWPTPTRWATFASFPLIPIVISFHILLLSLVRHIAWPENFVWPYLTSHGLTLYKDIFYIYPPLYIFLLVGFSKIAGLSLISIQVFSYLIIACTDVLLFWTAGKKVLPVIIYVLLQIAFEGNGMWPDQLLAPIFLLAYLAFKLKRYFALGLFLGLALITKQTAGYFILVMILATKSRLKILAGTIIPIFMALIYLWKINVLADFYQQTLVYIVFYHIGSNLQKLWPTIGQTILLLAIFLPTLIIGIIRKKYLLVGLVVSASLGMFTRFSYFHLQPALPFLALLMVDIKAWLSLVFLIIFFIKVFLTTFGAEPKFLGQDEINNANTISQYIQPGQKTLILTSSDHYYFLTKTVPIGNFFTTSTPWNLVYPGVQERIINDLITEKPKFIVFEKGPEKITKFILKNYRLVLKLSDRSGIFEYYPMSLR